MARGTFDLSPVLHYRERLEDLFDKAAGIEDDDLQAELTRYICVICSGYLETAVEHVFSEHAKLHSAFTVRNYVQKRLSGNANPWSHRIVGLAGDFHGEWGRRLSEFMEGRRSEAIDGIVRNRNKIAHGDHTDIGLLKLRQWHEAADEVVVFLAQLCLDEARKR